MYEWNDSVRILLKHYEMSKTFSLILVTISLFFDSTSYQLILIIISCIQCNSKARLLDWFVSSATYSILRMSSKWMYSCGNVEKGKM